MKYSCRCAKLFYLALCHDVMRRAENTPWLDPAGCKLQIEVAMTFTQTVHIDLEGDMLTATQCKMARAFLRWNMNDLALRSSVSVNTIEEFENGRNMPIPATLMALRQAFEANLRCFFTEEGCGWCGWKVNDLLLPDECRVARAALGWSMSDLAWHAGVVSVNTIERFENGQSRPIPATQKALRQAFEEADVRFTETRGGRWDPRLWVAVTTG